MPINSKSKLKYYKRLETPPVMAFQYQSKDLKTAKAIMGDCVEGVMIHSRSLKFTSLTGGTYRARNGDYIVMGEKEFFPVPQEIFKQLFAPLDSSAAVVLKEAPPAAPGE